MIKDSKSQSFSDHHREPLPFLERKKIGAESYVSQRLSRIRKERAKDVRQKPIEELITLEPRATCKWKQFDQIKELKKNFLVSSNKIVLSQQILSSFEPVKKQLQVQRKKPCTTINYQQIINNLQPFSSAIRQLQTQKTRQNKRLLKSIQASPASVKLYRSMPKKKYTSKPNKLQSQTRLKYQEVYFLNVEKMSLLDSQEKKTKKFSDNYHSALVAKRSSSYCFEEVEDNNNDPNQDLFGFKGNFAKISRKIQEQIQEDKDRENDNLSREIEREKEKIREKQKNKKKQKQKEVEKEVLQQRLPKIMVLPNQDDEIQMQKKVEVAEGSNKKQLPFKAVKRRKKLVVIPFQTYYYRTLIWKVNWTNNMNVEIPQEYEHRLKVYIGKGNNSGLVRGLIKRRIWFAVTDKIQQANFVWTQLKSLPYFKLQQPYQPPSQPCQPTQSPPIPLSNPLNPSNSSQYQQSFLTKTDQKQQIKYIQNYYQSEQRTDQRLLARNKYFSSKFTKVIKTGEIRTTRMQNHLINNYIIGNKKALFNTMSNYYAEIGEDVFEYLPLTFHIKQGLEDQAYYKFLKYYYNRAKQIKSTNQKSKNIWIVKPGQNSNRGNGISVCLTLQQIKSILKKKQVYTDGTYRTYIVQSYIEKPLLYNKRKFDLRHYMMISCVNGIVKGYWYKDGYVRTTSTEYNLGSNCSKIHLTNDAVQKNLPQYGKFEKGNKLSYDQLESYIGKVSAKKKSPVSFRESILPKMKKIATDAIRACSGGIDPDRKQNNFQIFGLDFMIDSDLKLYLIQINTNPCLQLSCPLLGTIIPKMLQNTLELTLDTQFPPPVRYYPKGIHYFKNLQQENKYQLVYDSRLEKLYDCGLTVLDQKLLEEEDDVFQDDDGEEFDPED